MTESNTGVSKRQRRKLRAHFGFSKLPFNKAMWAKQMFDSESQRELQHGLEDEQTQQQAGDGGPGSAEGGVRRSPWERHSRRC